MSNELSTPKSWLAPRTLPAGGNRLVHLRGRQLFLRIPCTISFDDEPSRVLSRCTTHGNVGLCDGRPNAVRQNSQNILSGRRQTIPGAPRVPDTNSRPSQPIQIQTRPWSMKRRSILIVLLGVGRSHDARLLLRPTSQLLGLREQKAALVARSEGSDLPAAVSPETGAKSLPAAGITVSPELLRLRTRLT